MAHVYVDSNAVGAGTGADWANAYTTLAAAFAAKAAGDNFWLAQDHAETQASQITLTPPGTNASPNTVICVNKAGTVPPVSADLATTATITTTSANAILMMASGNCYWYGITFNSGSGAVNTSLYIGGNTNNNAVAVFKNCAFKKLGTTGNGGAILIGGATSGGHRYTFDNCTFTLSSASDSIRLKSCNFLWKNTATPLAGTAPTILFDSNGALGGQAIIEGVDFSAYSGTLVGAADTSNKFYHFKDCKLHASVTINAVPTTNTHPETMITRCDSSSAYYRAEKSTYTGKQTIETTIVRTGGASDGVTPIAWKIVTTANPEWMTPFECPPIAIWNSDVTGNLTVTVCGIWGGGAVPNNDDIWMDIEYMGTSGNPLGAFTTTGKADILAAATAVDADTSTWGGSTTKFKLTKTFTAPAQVGMIYVYIKIADISATYYIDPLITLS